MARLTAAAKLSTIKRKNQKSKRLNQTLTELESFVVNYALKLWLNELGWKFCHYCSITSPASNIISPLWTRNKTNKV